jgi:hypothetical protein
MCAAEQGRAVGKGCVVLGTGARAHLAQSRCTPTSGSCFQTDCRARRTRRRQDQRRGPWSRSGETARRTGRSAARRGGMREEARPGRRGGSAAGPRRRRQPQAAAAFKQQAARSWLAVDLPPASPLKPAWLSSASWLNRLPANVQGPSSAGAVYSDAAPRQNACVPTAHAKRGAVALPAPPCWASAATIASRTSVLAGVVSRN